MNQELGIRNKIKSFTDLDAWKEAHDLVLTVYTLTKRFPHEGQFGLVNQLRRAVVSVTSNIAEGFSRYSYKEKSQFYSMALGSLTEIQNQLLISRDIGYLSQQVFTETAEKTVKVNKIINGLAKKSRAIHNS